MPQNQAAPGTFDRTMNHVDGVGSLKHGPRMHPAHAEGCLVYNSADWDGQNGNPGSKGRAVIDRDRQLADTREEMIRSAKMS